MGVDQYHEPPQELPAEARTFVRICTSLIEEAEAIGWYEQRLAVEPDATARAIMRDARGEEFKHFSQDLEYLLRRNPQWRETARGILFQEGDIVQTGEEAEESASEQGDLPVPEVSQPPPPAVSAVPAPAGAAGSLAIGSLRGAGL